MGKGGLDKLLKETYKDLDRLLEYTFVRNICKVEPCYNKHFGTKWCLV